MNWEIKVNLQAFFFLTSVLDRGLTAFKFRPFYPRFKNPGMQQTGASLWGNPKRKVGALPNPCRHSHIQSLPAELHRLIHSITKWKKPNRRLTVKLATVQPPQVPWRLNSLYKVSQKLSAFFYQFREDSNRHSNINIIHSVHFLFYVYCPTNVHFYSLLICETQCYMFRTLSWFIFRDFSILNYADFLHQWTIG
jgi:hypothetical protein